MAEPVKVFVACSLDEELVALWISPGELRKISETHSKHNISRVVNDLPGRDLLGTGVWVWEGTAEMEYIETWPWDCMGPQMVLDYIDYAGGFREPTPEEWESFQSRSLWRQT